MSLLSKKNKARDFSMKSNNSLVGKVRKRDSVFQDNKTVRNSKRADRRQANWYERHARPVAFVGGTIFGWLVSVLIISGLMTVIAKWLFDISKQGNIHVFDDMFQSMRNHHSLFIGAFAYVSLKPWILIPSILVGTLAMVALGKQAAKIVAKLDDTAMLTDVDDSWIWSVGEMIEQYAVIADFGMHSKTASVSGIVGHIYLQNKGLNSITMAMHDEAGNILYDDDGNVIRKKVPMINNKNIRKVLDMQGLSELDVKNVMIDATKYDYDLKDGRYRKLSEAINEDWFMPDYEILRPMGAYFVETNSVHTLVLSMTRGNKTQLVTQATVDTWRRDNTLWNLLVNDPKGGARRFLVKS